jgi:hypothetical protein
MYGKEKRMMGMDKDRVPDVEQIDRRDAVRKMLSDCRGFYGEGFGSGLSPYTDFSPDYSDRIRDGESPYTILGPAIWPSPREYGFGATPYTRFSPNYAGRQSSGESPYTDFGPFPC